MENHRTTPSYSEAFQTFLSHTNEKQVLLEALSLKLQTLGIKSLLDIGAGNGDLSIPLAKNVGRYLAVEQKTDFVKCLEDAGLEVISSSFPCEIQEEFDAVLLSHSLPPHKEGRASWETYIASAWSQVKDGGHLLIVTFDDTEGSEWGNLIEESGLEEIKPRVPRTASLNEYLETLGTLKEEVITTHVQTKTLDEMQRALAFVWSDGKAENTEAFFQNEEIARRIQKLYWDGESYVFPFRHHLLDIQR